MKVRWPNKVNVDSLWIVVCLAVFFTKVTYGHSGPWYSTLNNLNYVNSYLLWVQQTVTSMHLLTYLFATIEYELFFIISSLFTVLLFDSNFWKLVQQSNRCYWFLQIGVLTTCCYGTCHMLLSYIPNLPWNFQMLSTLHSFSVTSLMLVVALLVLFLIVVLPIYSSSLCVVIIRYAPFVIFTSWLMMLFGGLWSYYRDFSLLLWSWDIVELLLLISVLLLVNITHCLFKTNSNFWCFLTNLLLSFLFFFRSSTTQSTHHLIKPQATAQYWHNFQRLMFVDNHRLVLSLNYAPYMLLLIALAVTMLFVNNRFNTAPLLLSRISATPVIPALIFRSCVIAGVFISLLFWNISVILNVMGAVITTKATTIFVATYVTTLSITFMFAAILCVGSYHQWPLSAAILLLISTSPITASVPKLLANTDGIEISHDCASMSRDTLLMQAFFVPKQAFVITTQASTVVLFLILWVSRLTLLRPYCRNELTALSRVLL